MKRHDFKPRSINPLTCETCKEPKAAAQHSAKPTLVGVSFQLPADVFAELELRVKNTQHKSASSLAKSVVVKALGYEWSPPQPKRVIPAQPGRFVKKPSA